MTELDTVTDDTLLAAANDIIQQVTVIAETDSGKQSIVLTISENQLITQLQNSVVNISTDQVQGPVQRTIIGGVNAKVITLPSGRVWDSAKEAIDRNTPASAPNSFAY